MRNADPDAMAIRVSIIRDKATPRENPTYTTLRAACALNNRFVMSVTKKLRG